MKNRLPSMFCIGPPCFAQRGILFQEELERRIKFQSPMRTFGVVPEKPWDEFTVELIGSDQ